MKAYKLSRENCCGWIHAGTTPEDVAEVLKNELDGEEGLPDDECDRIIIEAYETTQEEIDNLPEFQGW